MQRSGRQVNTSFRISRYMNDPPTQLASNPSIFRSVNLSIDLAIRRSICLSVYRSIDLSIYLPIWLSVIINLSSYLSSICLSIRVHLSSCLCNYMVCGQLQQTNYDCSHLPYSQVDYVTARVVVLTSTTTRPMQNSAW